MLKVVLYILFSPIILIAKLGDILIWNILSSPNERERRRNFSWPKYWQEKAIEATRQVREMKKFTGRQIEDLQAQHCKELQKMEREVSILRSR